ncbi:MAG: hypothetical protein JWO37_2151 [Acidimicrobiales bacterium]|jgi:uncharacterized membrane protein|nr:hypothetical protein [Acidimicrobiales bacterium]
MPPNGGNEKTPDDEEAAGLTASLWTQLRRVERLLDPGVKVLEGAHDRFLVPAWRRVTEGEPRWPVSIAIIAAIAMQLALPKRLAFHPRYLLPALEFLLLVGLVIANPTRINRESARLRSASIMLIGVISVANVWSAARLVNGLVQSHDTSTAPQLMVRGGAVWMTNVIVFALWYWELDRGGPVARAMAVRPLPDFLFPQMQSPELAPPDWEPAFVDYLYVSFTNATAFSPTDVLPLARWAKLTMMLQSGVSLITVALVIARAVNILK